MTKVFHSIRTKLLILLLLPLFFYVIVATYLLNELSSTVDQLSDRLYEKGSVISQLVLSADRDLYQALTAYMTATRSQLDEETRKAALASFDENLQQTRERMNQAWELMEQGGLQDLADAENGKTLRALVEDFQSGLDSWEILVRSALQDPSSAAAGRAEVETLFDTTRLSIDQIEEIVQAYQQQSISEEKEETARITKVTYITLVVEWSLLLVIGCQRRLYFDPPSPV